jgi:hypothetical protein
MKLAILFWFYKEIAVCKNRIDLLRRLNPDTKIYGLFGGETTDALVVKSQLGPFLDDLYIYTENHDTRWKWLNGDLMIAQWHFDRGRELEWDTLVIVQWDMLMLRPIESLFGMLHPGEMLLSGLRPTSEVEMWWPWLQESNFAAKRNRDAFVSYLHQEHGYTEEMLCCLFIVACFPRRFLDRYVEAGPPKIGFLEYKVPTLARVFGVPFCQRHAFIPWWAADPATESATMHRRFLNAGGYEMAESEIIHATRAGHAYVFHPYRKAWNWPVPD